MIYKHFHQPPKKKESSPSRAAVIRYDKGKDQLPTIVAQGSGEVAKKIIAEAKKHDVPMQEDALLLENLLELDLGTNVPPQLYQVVAEVLLLVRRANTEAPVPVSLPPQQTPFWENEDAVDEREESDISLDDLLKAINSI